MWKRFCICIRKNDVPRDERLHQSIYQVNSCWCRCFVGILFPVLDIFRLAVRDATANKHFCDSESNGPRLVDYACAVFANCLVAQPKNQLLMLRALCNTFQHAGGEQLMLNSSERLLAAGKVALQNNADKTFQVTPTSVVNVHCGPVQKLSSFFLFLWFIQHRPISIMFGA